MKHYVPRFILEQFKAGNSAGTFCAGTMHVDMSGFTALTESLMVYEKEGAEVLSDVLERIFRPIVKNIYENGGFISTYSGDAFTAIFRNIGNVTDQGIIRSADFISRHLNVHTDIATKLGNFAVGAGIGLSFGDVDWGIFGRSGRNTYWFKGEALKGCIESEKLAGDSEIVVDGRFTRQLTIDMAFLAEKTADHWSLNPRYITAAVSRKFSAKAPERGDLELFIPAPVLNFKGRAEFREVVSVYISMHSALKNNDFNDFVAELADQCHIHGGYLNKIDFGAAGSVALILFGAPVSYENNIERAFNFALNVSRGASGRESRAGISCGTVYAGIIGGRERCEYTAIGDTVNLSARLALAANWGKMWTDENTSRKGRRSYRFEKVGNFTFRGKSAEVAVYELTARNESLEGRMFQGATIGREDELRQLTSFCGTLFAGQFAGVVYICGEAGIGKSRLAWEFRNRLEDSVRWCYLPCEGILRKSYNPVIQFLKDFFDVSEEYPDERNRENFLSRFNGLIAAVQSAGPSAARTGMIDELVRTKSILGGYLGIGFAGSLYERLDARARHQNFIYAVKNLVKCESTIRPVVIQLEDANRVDADTASLLRFLVRNIRDYPILLLCTARYGDDGSRFSLELEEETSSLSLDLSTLSRSSINKCAGSVLDGDSTLSAELLDMIYAKTGGNPFFTEQLMLDMKESDLLLLNDRKEVCTDVDEIRNIPSDIQAVVVSRLDRLPEDLRETVQTACVLGSEFPINVLAHMLSHDPRLEYKLSAIETEKIWVRLSGRRCTFRHALLRDATYDMQLRSRLRELHESAAKSYEEVFAEAPEEHYSTIAFHYQQAEIEDSAVYYLIQAANYAKSNYRNQEAIAFYRSLLKRPRKSFNERIDISIKLGHVLELIGEWAQAENIFRECLAVAEQKNDRLCRARFSAALGGLLLSKGENSAARELLHSAIGLYEALGDVEGTARTVLNLGILHWNLSDYAEALVCFQRSLKLYEKLEDPKGISAAIGNIGIVHKITGDYDSAERLYERQAAICRETGNREELHIALGNMGIIHWVRGDFSRAMACFEKKMAICKEIGDKRSLAIALGNMGVLFSNQGDDDRALDCYERSISIGEELGDSKNICNIAENIGAVLLRKGDIAGANAYLDRAIAIGRELNNRYILCESLYNKADVLYKMDHPDAEKVISEALEISSEIDRRDTGFNSRILMEKIRFKSSAGLKEKTACIANLMAMLQDATDQGNIADIHYEIAKLMCDMDVDCSTSRDKAVSLYRMLFQRTPNVKYRERYEELEALGNSRNQ